MARIKPKPLALMLTTYFWPMVLFLVLGGAILRPSFRFIPVQKSYEKSSINKTKMPYTLAHFTDMHISDLNMKRSGDVWDIFHTTSTIIKPVSVIITGDITEGSAGRGKLSHHGQFEQNWLPFIQIAHDHKNLPLIMCTGNHDEVLVSSINSSSHFFNKYILNGNSSKFTVDTHYIETEDGKIRVITFNPFSFPSPPIPLNLFATPTRKMLDDLEETLKAKTDAIYTIVACHYPIQSIQKNHGTSGKNFEHILATPEYKVKYLLTGHFHIPECFTQRFSHSIEAIGSTIEKKKAIALISFDNGIESYSNLDMDSNVLGILTSPPPSNQFLNSSKYTPEDTRARFLAYTKEPMILEAKLDGKEIGTMEVDAESETQTVYGIDIHTSPGHHKITISGDFDIERDFFVGSESSTTVDIGLSFYLHYPPLMTAVVVVNFLIVLSFVLPIIFDNFFSSFFMEYGHWLFNTYGRKGPRCSLFINSQSKASDVFCFSVGFVRAIVVGPLYVIWRLHFTPRKCKILMMVMYFETFVLPFHFVTGLDKLSAVTFWGFLSRENAIIDTYCLIVHGGMCALVFIPLILVGGLYSENYRWCRFLTLEFFVWILMVQAGFVIAILLILSGGGVFAVLTSPALWVILIQTYIYMDLLFKERKVLMTSSGGAHRSK